MINHRPTQGKATHPTQRAGRLLDAIRQSMVTFKHERGLFRADLETLAAIQRINYKTGACRSTTLVKDLVIDCNTMSERLSKLLRLGLIYREVAHGRGYLYFVTADGVRVLVEFDLQVRVFSV